MVCDRVGAQCVIGWKSVAHVFALAHTFANRRMFGMLVERNGSYGFKAMAFRLKLKRLDSAAETSRPSIREHSPRAPSLILSAA